jgi:hypothetical protein
MESPRADWRNVVALLSTYAYIGLVVWVALEFFRWREGLIPWWTDIPVGLIAVALIGPAQHRLLVLGQEAALGLLFRNRWLNELAGDWLIHFPFSTATHHVRQQVLAHYRFPNDPDGDAELVIARRAGFWPLRLGRLLRLSAIIRWHSLRATYNFEPNPNNPYFDPARPPSKVALHIGTAYVLVTFALLLGLYFFRAQLSDDVVAWVLTYIPVGLWVLVMGIFVALPDSKYHRGRMEGVYSAKTMTLMRITFITLVNTALGWITFSTGRSAVLNYIALWIGPVFTSTAALMLIRQWRQHGNLPEGEVAHDRRPGLLRRLTLFPLNQHRHREKHAAPERPWYWLGRSSKRPGIGL